MNAPIAPKTAPSWNPPPSAWPALALIPLAAGYRVLLAWLTVSGEASSLPGWMLGFTPLAALALGGGCFLPRRWSAVVPVGVLFLSDLAASRIYGMSLGVTVLLSRYGCLLALCAAGAWLGSAPARSAGAKAAGLLLASLAGSTLFYLVTNSLTWLGSPDYAQTVSGWAQALTVGLPGYPPTWIFFRNALVSDLLVSMLLAATCLRWSQRERRPAGAARQATV